MPWSTDENLFHISYESGILEDPNATPPTDMWKLTVSPEDAPQTPGTVALSFQSQLTIPCSATKFGVPRPVTGSQPVPAEKPFVPQPGLLPETISFKAEGLAYNNGLRNPRVVPFVAKEKSLRSAMTPEKVGAAQDVPSTDSTLPETTTWNPWPCAATSG